MRNIFLKLSILTLLGASLALPNGKIVGGHDAEKEQFPHQVSLLKNNVHVCGGSVISTRHILTAAHCVVMGDGVQPHPIKIFSVRVGSINRLAGGELVSVGRIIVNENYSHFVNDVAILVLSKPLTLSKAVAIIQLADEEIPAGETVRISGWGRLEHKGTVPWRLQFNDLTTITREDCDKKIGWNEDSILCLDHTKDNGSCDGDSGGPATYQGRLVGIAGFVYGGCGSSNPDGYAKVSYHK